MAKHKLTARQAGMMMPPDAVSYIARDDSYGVMGTFSEEGVPRTTIIRFIYPKTPDGMIIAIDKDCKGYINMVWQRKVSILIMGPGDVAYSFLCHAGVVKAPSDVHPTMNIVKLDIIDITSARDPVYQIYRSMQSVYTCEEAEWLSDAIRDELQKLCKEL